MTDELVGVEEVLNRFRRLIAELMRGSLRRNTFEPWEIEILLDLETCTIEPRKRTQILLAYQRAVERQMTTGPGSPMKLSEYLQSRTTRRPATE